MSDIDDKMLGLIPTATITGMTLKVMDRTIGKDKSKTKKINWRKIK
jgi:hypothetical protein